MTWDICWEENQMPCPECSSEEYGVTQQGDVIVMACGACGYAEEARPSDVALYEMEGERPEDEAQGEEQL